MVVASVIAVHLDQIPCGRMTLIKHAGVNANPLVFSSCVWSSPCQTRPQTLPKAQWAMFCSKQTNLSPYHPSYSHAHSHCLSYHHYQDSNLKMSRVSGIASSLYVSKLILMGRPITTLTPSSAKLTELGCPAPRASRSCMVFGTPY